MKIVTWTATHLHVRLTGVHPPEGFLAGCGSLAGIITIGTVGYHYLEGWSYLDSLYFSAATVTTVGYGDLYPTSPLSKVFTLIIMFSGIGLGFYVLSTFAGSMLRGRDRRLKHIEEMVEGMREKNKTG
ncbi:MAG: potassium channel family protein [Candidatus Woesebacteria bacterium]